MARFFLEQDGLKDDKFVISGEDLRHIQKVLRLKVGDDIEVVSKDGKTYLGEIIFMDGSIVRGEIIEAKENNTEPPIKLILIQGIPKGEKMELIIQKATELGISEIWPVNTQRSIVKLEPKKAEQRVIRWQKIAQEAAKQCKRSLIPQIMEIKSLRETLDSINKDDLLIIPWEGEKIRGLKGYLKGNKEYIRDKNNTIYIFIGPEGGIAEEEIEFAIKAGGTPVTLGPRILRTETAGIAVITMVLYHIGDLGGSDD